MGTWDMDLAHDCEAAMHILVKKHVGEHLLTKKCKTVTFGMSCLSNICSVFFFFFSFYSGLRHDASHLADYFSSLKPKSGFVDQ